MVRKLFGILGIVVVISLTFTACGGENSNTPDPAPVTPIMVTITVPPASKNYTDAGSIVPLTVIATANDDATLSYQWYDTDTFSNSGGTQISGETESSYLPTITDGEKFYFVEAIASIGARKGSQRSNPVRIKIGSDPEPEYGVTVTNTQYQYVQGFGGMSNAFNIGGSEGAPARFMEMTDIETMFNPNTGLGLTFLRIMIFPYPLEQVLRGEIEPQMNNAQTYLNAVKRVNSFGGYVLASPWTAPAHYKTNDSLRAGGHLKPDMVGEYAKYLRNYTEEMSSYGAPIYAVSIQNEPSLVVSYDGMEFTETEHRDFLRDHGNFTRSPSAIKGFGGGKETDYVRVVSGEPHQIGSWWTNAMDMIINNSAAHANLDVGAYHIYGGSGDYNTVSRNGRLQKDTWMTEYNINSQNEAGYWNDSTWNMVWIFAETIHQVIGVNRSNAYIWWYLKRFYGIIGDGSYGTANGAIMPRGHVLSHYAKYATDTVMVNATHTHPGGVGNIRLTAYQRKSEKTTAVEQRVVANEDSYSVVLYDRRTSTQTPVPLRVTLPDDFTASTAFGIISSSNDYERRVPLLVVLADNGKSADITMPGNAIISLKFIK